MTARSNFPSFSSSAMALPACRARSRRTAIFTPRCFRASFLTARSTASAGASSARSSAPSGVAAGTSTTCRAVMRAPGAATCRARLMSSPASLACFRLTRIFFGALFMAGSSTSRGLGPRILSDPAVRSSGTSPCLPPCLFTLSPPTRAKGLPPCLLASLPLRVPLGWLRLLRPVLLLADGFSPAQLPEGIPYQLPVAARVVVGPFRFDSAQRLQQQLHQPSDGIGLLRVQPLLLHRLHRPRQQPVQVPAPRERQLVQLAQLNSVPADPRVVEETELAHLHPRRPTLRLRPGPALAAPFLRRRLLLFRCSGHSASPL